jgi:hypothetical protein
MNKDEPLRFRLLLLGLAVLWLAAWTLSVGPALQQAETVEEDTLEPALVTCEPGAPGSESALLRCIEMPAAGRLKDI